MKIQLQKFTALIIFVRFPVAGKVKTRLAETIGSSTAKDFYKLVAENTFAQIAKLEKEMITPFIFCSEKEDLQAIIMWAGKNFQYKIQQGNNLGKRMYNALKTLFDEGFKKVIIIGTDLPDFSSNDIDITLSLLDKYDVVIGPSEDGGYYLLAMRQAHHFLFKDINWSTNTVLSSTIKLLNKEKLKYSLLEEKMDIDTIDDLKKWYAEKSGKTFNNYLYDFAGKILSEYNKQKAKQK